MTKYNIHDNLLHWQHSVVYTKKCEMHNKVRYLQLSVASVRQCHPWQSMTYAATIGILKNCDIHIIHNKVRHLRQDVTYDTKCGICNNVWHQWQYMTSLTTFDICDKVWHTWQSVTSIKKCEIWDKMWHLHMTAFDMWDKVWHLQQCETSAKLYDICRKVWHLTQIMTLEQECDIMDRILDSVWHPHRVWQCGTVWAKKQTHLYLTTLLDSSLCFTLTD